jgi:glycosyltransferase involved in cell wall biosynthesis
MIKVGFDISALDPEFKAHAGRGIGRYVGHVAGYLREYLPPDVGIEWFNHRNLLTSGVFSKLIGLVPFARTTIRQQLLYPLRLNTGPLKAAQCVHFPAHMDGPAWSRKPYILTVHDLIPLILDTLYRENRPAWRYELARWLEVKSIRNALLLLAVSETTANDVHRLLGVPRERIVVTPNGVEQSFFDQYKLRREMSPEARTEVRQRLGIPQGRPILLYVGGHDERKNVKAAIEIASEVLRECAESGKPVPVLVLAGKIESQRERDSFETALRNFAMASDTVNLGFVAEDDLRALYAESAVFLFPSLYEGFGLPVLEAMAAGVPVVSSNRGALAEVAGKAALLFDPVDVIAGAQGVLSVLQNHELAHRLSESGHQQAGLFSWERTGRLTIEAYRYAASLIAKHPVHYRKPSDGMSEEDYRPTQPMQPAGNAE